MSFYSVIEKYRHFDFEKVFKEITPRDVEAALISDFSDEKRLLALLSPTAEFFLEEMAAQAQHLTVRHFGRLMQMYTPMYLSNYCENRCLYCAYQRGNRFPRKKLSLEEAEQEAAFIADKGFQHLLVLTGESRVKSPVSYIRDCVKLLKKYFSSVSIEIYPLDHDGYKELIQAGVCGLTLYQETYNEELYDKLHLKGPKKNYLNRLNAPERGARAGMHFLNIGALLGLGNWRLEAFFTGLHALYLQNLFPGCEIGMSIPRIRPHKQILHPLTIVKDADLVQIVTAMRLFLPRASIALSTRENKSLRDHLIPLGITMMSASSNTQVGGHTLPEKGLKQFEISDTRNLEELKKAIRLAGYQPVLKNWS